MCSIPLLMRLKSKDTAKKKKSTGSVSYHFHAKHSYFQQIFSKSFNMRAKNEQSSSLKHRTTSANTEIVQQVFCKIVRDQIS